MGHRGGLGHGLDDASLVVGQHQRQERRALVTRQLRRQCLEVDHAVPVDADDGSLGAGRQPYRIMFDGRYQEPAPGRPGGAQRQVVGLAATAGEDDFVGAGADQAGNLGPRLFDGPPRRLARAVQRRGIASQPQRLRHGLGHRRLDRRAGVVVEVSGGGHDGNRILLCGFVQRQRLIT